MRKFNKLDLEKLARSGIIALIAISIASYVYFYRTGETQQLLHSIRAIGFSGVLLGIVIQAATNILPVPGEFITVILMEIYGPVWGGVCSWIGGMLGAVGAMYATRWIARPFAHWSRAALLNKVNSLVERRGSIGLLMIRFVPLVPYHFVNYASGLLHVRLWPFVWTTAIGLLPYTVAVSGLYAGIRHGSIMWGIGGAAVFGVLALVGLLAKKAGGKRLAVQPATDTDKP